MDIYGIRFGDKMEGRREGECATENGSWIFSESETGTKFKKMEEEGVKNAPWLPFFGNSYISERII